MSPKYGRLTMTKKRCFFENRLWLCRSYNEFAAMSCLQKTEMQSPDVKQTTKSTCFLSSQHSRGISSTHALKHN
jgi:hypothetical protein